MKKSVILIISVVYLASVLIVGIMGLKIRLFNETVYINEIIYQAQGERDTSFTRTECVSYKKTLNGGFEREYVYKQQMSSGGVVIYEVGDVQIQEKYAENLTIELKFTIQPDNATAKTLEYAIPNADKYKINGEVVTDKTQMPQEGDTVSGWVILTQNADGNAELTFKKTDESARKAVAVAIAPTNASTAKRTVRITIKF